MDKKFFGIPVLVLCLLVCFIILCNPFVMVGPGERGIKIKLGEVQPESYGEGLHFIFPFIQKFRTMDVKTQRNTKLYVMEILFIILTGLISVALVWFHSYIKICMFLKFILFSK